MAMVHLPLFTRIIDQYVSFPGDRSFVGLLPPVPENVQWKAPVAFTVRNLKWKILGNLGTGRVWTLVLMKNQNLTLLTSTISDVDFGENTADSVSVVAGDLLIWRITGETGEPSPARINSITYERVAEANQ